MSMLDLPDDWKAKASEAQKAVKAARQVSVERTSKEVSSRASVWADAKKYLADLSSGKCWYCESRQIRTDMTVDHYRPKSRVAENLDHPGYWWLAFEPNNYRLCCTFCNSRRVMAESDGGKQDSFPILDESNRAMDRHMSIHAEIALILDPTKAVDVVVLDFNDEGRAVGNPHLCLPGSVPAIKVAATEKILHLNERNLKDARKMLNRNLKRSFDDVLGLLPKYRDGDLSVENILDNAIHDLLSSVKDSAEYSSVARAYLKGRRGDGEDARQVLSLLSI